MCIRDSDRGGQYPPDPVRPARPGRRRYPPTRQPVTPSRGRRRARDASTRVPECHLLPEGPLAVNRRPVDPLPRQVRARWLGGILDHADRGEIISSWHAQCAPTFMRLTRAPTTEELHDRPKDFVETAEGWPGRLPPAEKYVWKRPVRQQRVSHC